MHALSHFYENMFYLNPTPPCAVYMLYATPLYSADNVTPITDYHPHGLQ